MKHTKGPWVVVKFDESNEIQTVDGKIIADVWKKNNSALFAAAPELLDAANALIYRIREGLNADEVDSDAIEHELKLLETAVAKAEEN